MITDSLDNIFLYKNIPNPVVEFIKNIDKNVNLGRYNISENIYANVEEYFPKKMEDAKFESHNNYIDIQFLIRGTEKIAYTLRDNLKVAIPYDSDKDITFYSDNVSIYPDIKLDGTNFMMIFPHEAHAPQILNGNSSDKVLKVVVKIKI